MVIEKNDRKHENCWNHTDYHKKIMSFLNTQVGDGDDAAKQSTTESNGHQSTPSCKLQALEESNAKNQFIDAAAFWINGWRSQLCKCQSCLVRPFFMLFSHCSHYTLFVLFSMFCCR